MKKQFLQEGKFYRVLEEDGTTFGGFENSTKVDGVTEAPDWNPNSSINCGKGLHVVEGHPFVALEIINRKDPIFFEVETDPNPPVMSFGDGKYRCKKVRNKRRLTEQSPEFRQELLARIAKENENPHVRLAAVEMLDPQKYSQLLARFAKEDWDWDVRRVAVKGLDPQKYSQLLAQIAKEDENEDVRRAAAEKMNFK